jgi:hypothetical protein
MLGTGFAPAPNRAGALDYRLHPSRSSKTRIATLLDQRKSIRQACRKDTVEEIVQGVADRWGIEQVNHDVKEIERIGQVQLRKVWANVGAFNLGLWVNSLVELWAWRRGEASLVDRGESPWDDAERRASHADRRKALQKELLESEFRRHGVCGRGSRKIRKLFQAVVKLVA